MDDLLDCNRSVCISDDREADFHLKQAWVSNSATRCIPICMVTSSSFHTPQTLKASLSRSQSYCVLHHCWSLYKLLSSMTQCSIAVNVQNMATRLGLQVILVNKYLVLAVSHNILQPFVVAVNLYKGSKSGFKSG